ncbi:MAG: PEP-CTERM sorting domain-containing protein, partial [Pirellulales bacterium]
NPQNSATFKDLDLTLIGNEGIQHDPPGGSPVTADRVEAWLAAHLFERVAMASPIDFYQDSVFASLRLTDYLDPIVELAGGYNLTPVDGDGLNFQLTARLIPEPNTFVLIAIGFAILGFRRRQIDSAEFRRTRS